MIKTPAAVPVVQMAAMKYQNKHWQECRVFEKKSTINRSPNFKMAAEKNKVNRYQLYTYQLKFKIGM